MYLSPEKHTHAECKDVYMYTCTYLYGLNIAGLATSAKNVFDSLRFACK